MKIEKQKICLVLMFLVMAGIVIFVLSHDPYAEKHRNQLMELIIPLMGVMPFANGF